jgi:hypothetical protein
VQVIANHAWSDLGSLAPVNISVYLILLVEVKNQPLNLLRMEFGERGILEVVDTSLKQGEWL